MTSKLDIPLHEASLSIVRRCGAELCEIVNSKFGCVAAIEGVENESRTSFWRPPATIKPERRYEFMMRSGVKVSVWKADLTNFSADAVVNAANEDLHHYGGLALALSDAGGPQIQKESDDYIRKHGKLQTGEAVALGPGSLPCKKIIHAVGPYLPPNPPKYDLSKAKPFLEKAILNILDKVEKYHLATVAIPAISSGLFNYPLPECANTIVSTIKNYYDNLPYQNHRPKEIFLANHDDPTVQEMEKASEFKPVTVLVLCCLLFQTDVIVNTASVDRVLSIGKISSAILNKAGYGIQNEIKRAQKKGYIIRTQPYKLSCKEVFHTFCTDKVLYGSVLDCLRMAAAQQYNSITFPAIGTGALGFTKVESASIMLTAVSAFAQNCLNRMHVHFVIFPSDHEKIISFRTKDKCLLVGIKNNYTIKYPGIHKTRQNYLVCPNEESKHEAERWLKNGLSMDSHSFKIYNNFLSHFSDHDHLQLAVSAEKGLIVEEFFSKGHACLEINGDSKEEVAIAGFKVEAMLCKVQKEFIREEEHELQMLSNTEPSHQRKTVEKSSKEFSSRREAFNRTLRVTKVQLVIVEKVENAALKAMFDMKKKQLDCPSKPMIQRIPAQFCEMISRIGFHAECAPPEDPKYGEGIYFTRNIKTALELWKEKSEEYLYFVEAEVLLGNSAKGEPGFILPPPVGKDPNVLYDSVSGGSDVSVIFSGYQALPKYIIWAKKDSHSSYI
uniref:Poly [ADP-ribose] polymerase 9 n=1 Tax=Poecilia reticulata TaxID=8081 RepID=A0A3P9Q2A9_POERE